MQLQKHYIPQRLIHPQSRLILGQNNTAIELTNNTAIELIHAALKLRQDLTVEKGHMAGWKGIDEKLIEQIIPDSLHIFLGVLLGGTAILECETDNDTYDKQRLQMFNLAQDIIYTVSNYKKLTPKHVGLGLTVHHATRSEGLIDLLHAAGNTTGIDTIHRIDTSIASSILNKYEDNGYIYIPNEI